MNKKYVAEIFALIFFSFCICNIGFAQYDNLVEAKASTIDNETYGIIKLSRKDNHVKVKYFAAKDYYGTSVYDRYKNWAVGKKVVAVSSGTYMNMCETPAYATPIGICIDQGKVVNEDLVYDRLDALAIVYATGGMVVSNLKAGNLRVTGKEGNASVYDIRKSAYHKSLFVDWAQVNEATVFQTHLYVFEDKIMITSNGSSTKASRRFLAVCKYSGNSICHYIINLPVASTENEGVRKAYRILKEGEGVEQIVFMINLDTGCQNVFNFYRNGSLETNSLLKGSESISSAINLLAYYYE